MLKKNEVEPKTCRDAMARFGGAVHVVTTDGPAGRRGATVIATCSVSDNPPTILVCLNRENPSNNRFVDNGKFALNTLSADQRAVAEAFSGLAGVPAEKRFDIGEWGEIATGAPTLAGALAVFDCELVDSKDMATHRVLFGKVTGISIGDSLDPLLYFNRGYRVL